MRLIGSDSVRRGSPLSRRIAPARQAPAQHDARAKAGRRHCRKLIILVCCPSSLLPQGVNALGASAVSAGNALPLKILTLSYMNKARALTDRLACLA